MFQVASLRDFGLGAGAQSSDFVGASSVAVGALGVELSAAALGG